MSHLSLPDGKPPVDDTRAIVIERLRAHPLAALLTQRRIERMVDVLALRLTSVTMVLENLYDPHNVCAVVRSAEGFGLDRVHVVEQPNKFLKNHSILRGSDRWVHVEKHKELSRTVLALQTRGFVTAIADVGRGCVPVHELPVDGKLAIVMGSEHEGLSRRARSLADVRFTIPMQGFTESFNVSVSAAITLFDVTRRRRDALGGRGELTIDEQVERGIVWMQKSVKHAAIVEARAQQA
jgi:tRNA (guanosine-2'-O-)-methyltransferase